MPARTSQRDIPKNHWVNVPVTLVMADQAWPPSYQMS
jgi:hypothetical protein